MEEIRLGDNSGYGPVQIARPSWGNATRASRIWVSARVINGSDSFTRDLAGYVGVTVEADLHLGECGLHSLIALFDHFISSSLPPYHHLPYSVSIPILSDKRAVHPQCRKENWDALSRSSPGPSQVTAYVYAKTSRYNSMQSRLRYRCARFLSHLQSPDESLPSSSGKLADVVPR